MRKKTEFPKTWTIVWDEKDGQSWLVRNHKDGTRTFLRPAYPGEYKYDVATHPRTSILDSIKKQD